jgi:hypothetical protein
MSLPRKILESQNARLLRLGMDALRLIVKRIGKMRILLRRHPGPTRKRPTCVFCPSTRKSHCRKTSPCP